ncbi:MAG: HAMP domain-containing protein [SAR324 cluster bacterium]|nr:HAMP domain-containing protein [SAR324 cluster bacterium]
MSSTPSLPLQMTANLEDVKGELKTYTLDLGGEKLPQIEYKVVVNGLTIVFNLKEMPNQIRESLIILILSALGNIFVVFGIVWFVSGRLVAPLVKLKNLIQSITEGQDWWQREQTVSIEVHTQDEIGQLSRSFNEMLGYLNESYVQLVAKHNETRIANQEISHINEVVRTINSTLDLDTVMDSVSQALHTIFNFDQIGFALIDDSQQTVRFHKIYGKGLSSDQFLHLSEIRFGLEDKNSPVSTTIREKRPIFLKEVNAQTIAILQEGERQMVEINPVQSILMCPLEVQNSVQGLIFFGNRHAPFKLDERGIEKIQRYVVQIAIAINNARLYEDLNSTQVQLTATRKIAAMTKSFEKFVPNQFLRRIAKTGFENIEVGKAETDHITILFSDIRSFTNLTEDMSPQELLNFLNAYLERMNKPIHDNNGFIDKFIGDAIMALFDRHQETDSDEAVDAVKAALGMQSALTEYNYHRRSSGYLPIKAGMGIHSGPVIFGTVGSETRMESTVLGDAVNLASRLEALTKYYDVSLIISESTFLLLKKSIDVLWRELDYVLVKGKDRPVKIYELYDNDPGEIRALKRQISKLYHEGLVHYRAQSWPEATELFERCLSIYPQDRASQIFAARSSQYQKDPPPVNWDGSIRLEKA